MNTFIKVLLITSMSLGLLAGCAQPNPHPMDMTAAIHSARTKADHDALAAHYDQAAADAQKMVREHEDMLADYRKDPHDYPKSYKGGNFESHCQRMIDIYERAVEANRDMAAMHRQLAPGSN